MNTAGHLFSALDKMREFKHQGLNDHVKQRGWLGSTRVGYRAVTCRLYGIWINLRRQSSSADCGLMRGTTVVASAIREFLCIPCVSIVETPQ